MKIARQVADVLFGLGIKRVYGLPGEDHMALLDAFVDAGLDYCAAFNESSAAIMAATDAQITGLPGVVVVSLAPGASNAVNGILDAFLGEVPLLVISGQHPAKDLPFIVRQGFNIERLVSPITKWQGKVTTDMHVPNIVGKAIDEAMSGRPGPVFLEIADGVATAESIANESAVTGVLTNLRTRWLPDTRSGVNARADMSIVDELRRRLATAEHPVIILGGRKRRVKGSTIAEFAARYRMPVFTSARQKGVVHREFEYFAGTYLNGSLERKLLHQADLVFLVDVESFDFYNKAWNFSASAVAIVSSMFTEWSVPVPVQFEADPESTLRALIDDVGRIASKWEPSDVSTYRSRVRNSLLPESIKTFSQAEAVNAALEAWPNDGVLVADAGFSKPLVIMLADQTVPDRFLASHALSTMGYAIPAAVAARRAVAGPVLAFLGDGSLFMRATELMVSANDGLAGVFVVLVDGALTQIEVKQERNQLARIGTQLPNISCEAIAKALGIEGADVNNASDLQMAVAKGLHGNRPMLIGAYVDPVPSRVLFDVLRGS